MRIDYRKLTHKRKTGVGWSIYDGPQNQAELMRLYRDGWIFRLDGRAYVPKGRPGGKNVTPRRKIALSESEKKNQDRAVSREGAPNWAGWARDTLNKRADAVNGKK